MSAPQNDKDNPQRKILEGLQLKKQLILKQGVSHALNNPGASQQHMGWQSGTDGHIAGNSPRTNLVQATAQSFGYFIPQDSSFAANMLYTAESSFGDIKDGFIADLGCGCGMLSIGASLLGASHIVGFEIDHDALDIFQENLFDSYLQNIDIVEADVLNLGNNWHGKFDTVLLNPPFGTKQNQGIDISFLKMALDLSSRCILSLHKTSTRKYILKKAKDWGVDCQVIAVLRYNIPNMYKFHKKVSVDIEVDFIRFYKRNQNA